MTDPCGLKDFSPIITAEAVPCMPRRAPYLHNFLVLNRQDIPAEVYSHTLIT